MKCEGHPTPEWGLFACYAKRWIDWTTYVALSRLPLWWPEDHPTCLWQLQRYPASRILAERGIRHKRLRQVTNLMDAAGLKLKGQ